MIEDKNLEDWRKKKSKSLSFGSIKAQEDKRRKKSFEKIEGHVRGRKLFVLLFLNSISRVSIGYQSSQAKAIPQKF